MSFYINIANTIANETIVQKGQKLFLEGKVIETKEPLIPNWFSYGVKDNGNVFEVIAPTIHFIDPLYNSDNFFKLAHCNCEYYTHMGYCHHICAVLTHLDNVYKVSNKETKVNPSLWDTLMLGEKTTILNQYKFNLNEYFQHNWDDRDITKNLGSLPKDLKKFPELKTILLDILHPNSKLFENEKKLINLFNHNYLASQNSLDWFLIFRPYLIKIHSLNKEELLQKTYLNLYAKIFQVDSEKEIINFIRAFDSDIKTNVSEKLKIIYAKQPIIWSEFAFISQDKKTLMSSLDIFESKMLLEIGNLYPYEHDIIEIKLYNQVKVWIDFLYSTDYTDLLKIIEKWYLVFGKTEKFIEIIDYIESTHPKKKNLIKEIKSY
jgi:hypothetical protein